MSDLKHDLEDLQRHPGWVWFVERVGKDWGPNGDRFMPEMKAALNITDNNAAASQARQIISAQATMMALLRLPQEEVAKLRNLEKSPQAMRPELPQELIGQSRRGSL